MKYITYDCVNADGKIRIADVVGMLADHTLQQVADKYNLDISTVSKVLIESSSVIDKCWYIVGSGI